MPSCALCLELQRRVDIRAPEELSRALRVVRANLREGRLRETAGPPKDTIAFDPLPFDQVPENGPWSDILLYRFECGSCGARFQLFADTYHGEGKWEAYP